MAFSARAAGVVGSAPAASVAGVAALLVQKQLSACGVTHAQERAHTLKHKRKHT
jgi:hypothetical protein